MSDNYIQGFLRKSALRAAISSGLVDVFSGNELDSAGRNLVEASQVRQRVRESRAKVTSADVKLSRDIVLTRYDPLALAGGFERRREELDDRPADILFTGDIFGGGGAFPSTRA